MPFDRFNTAHPISEELRNRLLKLTLGEDRISTTLANIYAQCFSKYSEPENLDSTLRDELSELLSNIEQPAILMRGLNLEIKPDALVSTANKLTVFIKKIASAYPKLAGKLTTILDVYQNFSHEWERAQSDSKKQVQLLTFKATMTGGHLGACYYISQEAARKMLCVNLLGDTEKDNSEGNHPVAAFEEGVYIKPNPEGDHIQPAMQFMTSVFVKTIGDSALAPASDLLKISNVFIRKICDYRVFEDIPEEVRHKFTEASFAKHLEAKKTYEVQRRSKKKLTAILGEYPTLLEDLITEPSFIEGTAQATETVQGESLHKLLFLLSELQYLKTACKETFSEKIQLLLDGKFLSIFSEKNKKLEIDFGNLESVFSVFLLILKKHNLKFQDCDFLQEGKEEKKKAVFYEEWFSKYSPEDLLKIFSCLDVIPELVHQGTRLSDVSLFLKSISAVKRLIGLNNPTDIYKILDNYLDNCVPYYFSALFYASKRVGPTDWKPDNQILCFFGKDKKFSVTPFDNDGAFEFSSFGVRMGQRIEHVLNFKGTIEAFPQVYRAIDPDFRKKTLEKSPAWQWLMVFGILYDNYQRYEYLTNIGILTPNDLCDATGEKALDVGGLLPVDVLLKAYSGHKKNHQQLLENSQISHFHLWKEIDPLVANVYAELFKSQAKQPYRVIQKIYHGGGGGAPSIEEMLGENLEIRTPDLSSGKTFAQLLNELPIRPRSREAILPEFINEFIQNELNEEFGDFETAWPLLEIIGNAFPFIDRLPIQKEILQDWLYIAIDQRKESIVFLFSRCGVDLDFKRTIQLNANFTESGFPLDRAILADTWEIFSELILLGARKIADVALALERMQSWLNSTEASKPALQAAIKTLVENNRDIAAGLALLHLCDISEKEPSGEGSQAALRRIDGTVLRLKSDAASSLFSGLKASPDNNASSKTILNAPWGIKIHVHFGPNFSIWPLAIDAFVKVFFPDLEEQVVRPELFFLVDDQGRQQPLLFITQIPGKNLDQLAKSGFYEELEMLPFNTIFPKMLLGYWLQHDFYGLRNFSVKSNFNGTPCLTLEFNVDKTSEKCSPFFVFPMMQEVIPDVWIKRISKMEVAQGLQCWLDELKKMEDFFVNPLGASAKKPPDMSKMQFRFLKNFSDIRGIYTSMIKSQQSCLELITQDSKKKFRQKMTPFQLLSLGLPRIADQMEELFGHPSLDVRLSELGKARKEELTHSGSNSDYYPTLRKSQMLFSFSETENIKEELLQIHTEFLELKNLVSEGTQGNVITSLFKQNQKSLLSALGTIEVFLLSTEQRVEFLNEILSRKIALETLSIKGCKEIAFEHLAQVVQQSPHLKYLDISGCLQFSEKLPGLLKLLDKYCKRLGVFLASEVGIVNFFSEKSEENPKLASFFFLEQLDLSGNLGLEVVQINAPRLKYLSIGSAPKLRLLQVGAQQLEEVHIEAMNLGKCSDDFYALLASSPRLLLNQTSPSDWLLHRFITQVVSYYQLYRYCFAQDQERGLSLKTEERMEPINQEGEQFFEINLQNFNRETLWFLLKVFVAEKKWEGRLNLCLNLSGNRTVRPSHIVALLVSRLFSQPQLEVESGGQVSAKSSVEQVKILWTNYQAFLKSDKFLFISKVESGKPVRCAAIHPSGHLIVPHHSNGLCRLNFSRRSQQPMIQVWVPFQNAFNKIPDVISVLPDGNVVVGEDKVISIWSSSGMFLKELDGHAAAVSAIASVFLPGTLGGKWLVSGSRNGILRVWDLEKGYTSRCVLNVVTGSGEKNFSFSVQALLPYRAAFVLVALNSGELCLLDVQKGCFVARKKLYSKAIWTLAAMTERRVLTGSADHKITLTEIVEQGSRIVFNELCVYKGHEHGVYALQPLSSALFSSIGYDKKLYVWDVKQPTPVQSLPTENSFPVYLGLAQKGELVSVHENGAIVRYLFESHEFLASEWLSPKTQELLNQSVIIKAEQGVLIEIQLGGGSVDEHTQFFTQLQLLGRSFYGETLRITKDLKSAVMRLHLDEEGGGSDELFTFYRSLGIPFRWGTTDAVWAKGLKTNFYNRDNTNHRGLHPPRLGPRFSVFGRSQRALSVSNQSGESNPLSFS